MLLEFWGVMRSVEFLSELCETSVETGTPTDNIVAAAKKEAFVVQASTNNSLSDITASIDSGAPILINYIEAKSGEGHLALCVGYDDLHIIVHDPEYGPNFQISHEYLAANWRSGFEDKQRWMMSVRPATTLL